MSKDGFNPYADESAVVDIDGLTLENRIDEVTVYGDVSLTKDREGLEKARRLKALIDGVVAVLEAGPLPERIVRDDPGTVRNPFG